MVSLAVLLFERSPAPYGAGQSREHKRKTGFTLIELLIVIGILAVLVTTILITLNPAEAQKKARDVKRMKDLATLQAIVEQWINDGGVPFCLTGEGCYSTGAPRQSQPCSSNWLAQDLCRYTNSVPTDPINGSTGVYVNGCTLATDPTNMVYRIKMSGSDYKIGVLQESKSNAGKVGNDGGTRCDWVEVFSSQESRDLW